jgi:hypothetical protein
MTMNLYATQMDVFAYLSANLGAPVFHTNYPAAADEPAGENGVMATYAVLRVNDALRTTSSRFGGAIGGARHDEMYTLFDVLVVGHSPEAATELAYGPGGVADLMVGYTPADAGPLQRAGGGQVFVGNDGTTTRPTNYVARVSFRCNVNMIIDE